MYRLIDITIYMNYYSFIYNYLIDLRQFEHGSIGKVGLGITSPVVSGIGKASPKVSPIPPEIDSNAFSFILLMIASLFK